VTLLLISGRLWREIPSTGGWYTLDEIAAGLFAYRYSDDPSQGEPSPALSRGQVEAEGLRDLRPEPEALESAPGLAGQAKKGLTQW
jgi:hypothetical protein